jgi:DNA-binding MarR family transcriptional regulator
MIRAMDNDIARIYAERGVTGITPRQVMPIVRLERLGPMTIGQLAENLNVTHSAASQTVAALGRAGYVRTKPGPDARTRVVTLTPKGRALVPLFEAEWRATEAAIAELEHEVPHPISHVVPDLQKALTQRSFYDRILEHLEDED